MLFPYWFKTKFKIDEKFHAWNNSIWSYTAKGYSENKALLKILVTIRINEIFPCLACYG